MSKYFKQLAVQKKKTNIEVIVSLGKNSQYLGIFINNLQEVKMQYFIFLIGVVKNQLGKQPDRLHKWSFRKIKESN